MSKHHIKLHTAIAIVAANMIGTGVFTSLGFQLMDLKQPFSIVMLWTIGGVAALCGAFIYAELGKMFEGNGGEYNFLSKMYHPFIGFLSGFVSIAVGFAAPVALSSMLMGGYLNKIFPEISQLFISVLMIILIGFVHLFNLKQSSIFQNIFTSIKVLLIIFIIIAGLFFTEHLHVSFTPNEFSFNEILSPSFAIGFFFVAYSYSGWNAAAYISGEIENPKKNLPLALIIGTTFVSILYILLNSVFMLTAPINEMQGIAEVAYIPCGYIFGESGAKVVSLFIVLLLVSSISSMTWAGPRVISTIGHDLKIFSAFAKGNKHQIPVYAILFQVAVSLLFVITGTFEKVLTYLGFTLNIFTFLTALGYLKEKLKNFNKQSNKSLLFIIPTMFFLATGFWIIYFGIKLKTTESLTGLLTLAIGTSIYILNYIWTKSSKE